MKIYRKKDFKRGEYWEIFVPGWLPGETPEEQKARAERVLQNSGVSPIAETTKKITCGSLLEINGELYNVKITGRGICGVESLGNVDIEEPEEFEDASELYCPYCKKEIPDSFEIKSDELDDTCPNCGSVFHIVREVTVRWNSYPVCRAKIWRI